MAKYGPSYMSCYDGPEYSFGTVLLSALEFATLDPAGTDIGVLSAMADADDSVFSLVDENGAADTRTYVQLNADGVTLEVGAAGAALVPGTFDIFVRETNPWVAGQYHDTEFTITVTA